MWQWITQHLMHINITWYVILCVSFAFARNLGMFIYWLGALVITFGVYVTNYGKFPWE